MDEGQLLNGRYRLGDRLGEGGMSIVWCARDEVLDRSVAVKVLAGTFATDAAWRRRIRVEARAAASLSHPNVTNVYDYGETAEGNPFVVMELLRGPTLAERLQAGPLTPAATIRVCAEVAAGLAAAHAERFVHRDVKPANVVLTPGAAKLVDFGIVGIPGDPGSGLDADGLILGTPAYLAPERLVGDEVTPASDVYAFGLLLYRCLTGRLPWDSETTTQMLRSHVTVTPEPLPHLDGVPAQVRDLCMRCLVKAPAARPTAEEAAAVLAEAAGVSPRPRAEELDVVPPVPPLGADARTAPRTDGITEPAGATTALPAAPIPPAARIAVDPPAATTSPAAQAAPGPPDDGKTSQVHAASGPGDDGTTGAVQAASGPGDDGTTGALPAGVTPPGDGATDVTGDDAVDRRRVLAGLAVVVAVAALLVTFALSRPTGGPQASAEAARGGPGGTTGPVQPGTTGSPAPSTGTADPTPGGQPTATGTEGTTGPGGGPGGGPAGGPGSGGPGSGGPGNGGPGSGTGGSGGSGGGTPGGPGNGGATTPAGPAAGNPVRIGTPGGVIVAVCVGDQVNVTGADPAAGGSLVSLQSGPRGKSRVEFNLAGVRLRFQVRCVGGVPVATPD